MANIKAVNNNVFIIRDETESERGGLLLPSLSVQKPFTGTIFSVGKKVTDPDIKKGIGKKAVWHQTAGQEIEYEGNTFIALPEEHILGIDEISK